MIFSAAILVWGYLAFNRLNFWERSVRIFKMETDQPFYGRQGRGGFEDGDGDRRTTRPDFRSMPDSVRQRFASREGRRPEGSAMREMPDSIRNRFEAGRGQQGLRQREIPDSLRRDYRSFNGERSGVEAAVRGDSGHGRGGFAGKKINLGNVWWFTAVFASFTIIVIYIDRLLVVLRKRKRISVS